MKTYRTFLLTALLLFPKWIALLALEPTQRVHFSDASIHLVVSNSSERPRVGIPGRRVGAGTR